MHRSPRAALLQCSLALVCLGMGFGAATPVLAEDELWYGIHTPRFELIGQAPAEQLEQLAAELERLDALLGSLGGDPLRFRPPLTILALDRERLGTFGPRGADLGPRDNRITGYFVPGELEDHVLFDRDSRHAPRETLYHEYLHAFVRHELPAAPLWLNEGLAEYYSTFALRLGTDGKPTGVLGLPKERHLATLQREPMLPLDRLLRVEVGSPLYDEADRRGIFYAQAWALTHYLVSDDDRRARTSRYLSALARDAGDPEEAFRSAFGSSLASLELALRRYVESGSLPVTTVAVPDSAPAAPRAREIAEVDVDVALGDLLLAQRRPEHARERFERALADDPAHPLALAGMGRVHVERGNVPLALEWLEAAVAAPGASSSWLPSLALGEALIRAARESLPASGERAPAGVEAARQRFREQLRLLARARASLFAALELEPDLAPAHAAIGRAWLVEGGILGSLDAEAGNEAISALRSAIELRPERLETAVDLALVLCRVDRCADARRVVEELLPLYRLRQRSDDLLGLAREQVARIELDRAARLASAMQPDLALARIDQLVAALDGETLSALGPEIQEVTDVANHNAHVAAYNRALELARAGRYVEAARLLAPVLSEARDAELRASARELDALLRRAGAPR